jgi:hypothetical protein
MRTLRLQEPALVNYCCSETGIGIASVLRRSRLVVSRTVGRADDCEGIKAEMAGGGKAPDHAYPLHGQNPLVRYAFSRAIRRSFH